VALKEPSTALAAGLEPALPPRRKQTWPVLAIFNGLEVRVAESETACVDRDERRVPARAVAEHQRNAVAYVRVCRVGTGTVQRDGGAVKPGQEPATTPTSSPPHASVQHLRRSHVVGEADAAWAEHRRLSATAERPASRTSARAARRAAAEARDGEILLQAGAPRPLTAWSMVVLLNSKVQLSATDSTSGVLADEKRRVAARRLAVARKPPTGEIAESTGAASANARDDRPEKPTAATRKAFSSDVAAAVCGLCVTAETENSDRRRDAIPPPISLPRLIRAARQRRPRARVLVRYVTRAVRDEYGQRAIVTPLAMATVAGAGRP
jgi:hypothetical protein